MLICASMGLGSKGVYLQDCQLVEEPKPGVLQAYAVDGENAEKLWKISEKMVGQEFKY